jgi:hypothetical protein
MNWFEDLAFWHELRRKTSVRGSHGGGWCSHWCREALTLLPERHRFIKYEVTLNQEEFIAQEEPYYNTHRFIARRVGESYFVADGTAGGIESKFPLGFYGLLEEAPSTLTIFYQKRLK